VARTLRAELIKLRRTPLVWVALVGISLPPLLNALLVADRLSKGDNLGWETALGQSVLLSNLFLAIGLYGMVAVYLFASEHTDRAWEHLMVLPVGRGYVLVAKLLILLILTAVTAAVGFGVSLLLGLLQPRLPQLPAAEAWRYARTALTTALLTSSLMPVVIWITMAVRNYIVPIGTLIGLTVVNVFLVIFNADEVIYYPWSLPSLLAVYYKGTTPTPVSWVLAAAVTVIGLVLMRVHVYRADQGGAA